MRNGQGAIEYIIILGVIILIALIVVSSLGGLGIFSFSTTGQIRTTQISNLLSDVALQYVIKADGNTQVTIKSMTSSRVIAHNITFDNTTASNVCIIPMSDTIIRQDFTAFSNSTCSSLAGIAGQAYSFNCTLSYQDANNIEHGIKGLCQGVYEV